MPIEPGTKIGPYEVVSPLGAGGMGEVYRARDARLNREVALKILPELFARDPDRLGRFQREAQVLASLNHPNIAAIYGLEEAGPAGAIVLELIEGPTLEDRIAQGAIAIDEAVPIARQMCDALEAAHEKGIVHRDLKPANIKVSPNGVVKVLDFGLAKLADAAGPGANAALTHSPTMVTAASMPGVILGTAAYMSPEQARGKGADRATDVWAFGCVLYEMITGSAAFAGETISEIVSEVLKSEPDWTRLPPGTPESVRRLLRRCLQKDPKRRLHDITDARLELDETGESTTVMAAGPPAARRRERIALLSAVAIAFAIALVATWIAMRQPPRAPSAGVKRFQISMPPGADVVHFISVAASTAQLAIVASIGRRGAIWVRPLDSLTARRVIDIQAPSAVFWSPDGQSLGFFEGGVLKILNVATGQARVLCDAPNGQGGSWGNDGTILFAPNATGGIYRVSAQGGPVAPVTAPEAARGDESYRWPQWLPDGRHFVFMGWNSRLVRYSIHVGSSDSRTSTVIVNDAISAPLYDPSGALLYIAGKPPRLVAAPFDARALTITGPPIAVVDELESEWITGMPTETSAPDGTLLYRSHSRYSRPTWFDRAGRETGTVGEPGVYYDPALSRDGQSLVLEMADPNIQAGDIWTVDLARGAFSRVTRDPSWDNVALFSPDARRVVFSSDRREGFKDLYIGQAGETATAILIKGADVFWYASDWSSDGRYLLLTKSDQNASYSLWAKPMTGAETAPVRIAPADATARWGTFSWDGRWIAYQSDKSGDTQVYVRSWPDGAIERQISVNGGLQPQWRKDGRELFYASYDGSIMAASIATASGGLNSGTPMVLFNPGLDFYGLRNEFVPAPDGQRFLVIKPLVDRRSAPITAVLNWRSRN